MSNGYELLSLRLKTVFDSIPSDCIKDRFIDVGSDHGHLTCYALKHGGFKSSISTDIHKEPASKTKNFLEENSLGDISEVYCTDGLDGIFLRTNDVIVMAGLGGNNIMDILERAISRTSKEILKTITWVFQPQKTIEDLRVFVCENGFEISNEIVCVDRDIYYCIIVVRYVGVTKNLSLVEKYYGPVLINYFNENNVSEELKGYFELLNNRYILRARGDMETRRMLEEKGINYEGK